MNFKYLFLIFFSFKLFSQEVKPIINLDKIERELISENFSIFNESNSEKEEIESILKKQQDFKISKTKVAAYFASNTGHWLKFQLTSKNDRVVVIDFGTLSFDELDLYVIDNQQSIQRFPHLSWKVLPKDRPLKTEFYAYEVKLKRNEIYSIFVRGKNVKGTFRMPIFISNPDAFYQAVYQYERFFGIFFGVSIFIISIGISFYFLSKDKSYLFYVLSVISLIIQSAGINGYLTNLVAGFSKPMSDPTYANLFIPIFVYFQIKFHNLLLLKPKKSPIWVINFSNILGYYSIAMTIVMLACLIETKLFFYMSYMVYIMYLGMIINLILNLWQGFKFNRSNAYVILISSTPFFIYLLYMILTNLRIVKQISPYNIVMWCLMFDNIILCIGLAYRFGNLSKRELKLQLEISDQQKLNFETETKHQKEKFERLQAELNLQNERQRISKDLHDNIGSHLTYITSNLDYFSNKMIDNKEINLKLNQLGDFARNTTQQLRDTVWAMNKETVTLHEFQERVTEYVRHQFEVFEYFKLKIDLESQNEGLILSSTVSLNLFRVIQESINNALKHSKATEIVLKFELINQKLLVSIKDNGIGFVLKNAKNGNGLFNMKSRMEESGGEIVIESAENQGTFINMIVPLVKNTYDSVLFET